MLHIVVCSVCTKNSLTLQKETPAKILIFRNSRLETLTVKMFLKTFATEKRASRDSESALLKKRPMHKYFLENFVKFLRAPSF